MVFSVTDRGPGIPPDVLEKVFDWFETHSLGSQHRGPGLGLSLVRSFVELHGGTVTIDSVVGQGTTVTCTFPLVTAALTRLSAVTAAAASRGLMREEGRQRSCLKKFLAEWLMLLTTRWRELHCELANEEATDAFA